MASEESIVNSMNIGQAKSILTGGGGSPLSMLMQELLNDVIKELRLSLVKHDVRASGELSKSLSTTSVRVKPGSVEIGISAAFYAKFINYGVNGFERNVGAPAWGRQNNEGSFKDSIMGWIRDKGLTKPNGFATYDSYAYAIMTNIKKYGQEPRPFLTDVINKELAEKLAVPIAKVLGRSIEVVITDPWQ